MKNVKVIKLEVVKKDNKGLVFEFDNRKSSKLLLIKRKKGTISGGHYHTGKNKLKDPETLIMIDGKFKLILKNIKTKQESTKTYQAPIMFKIDPFIYHTIEALTDIIMLDMNSIKDDNDTIY